MPSFLRLNVLFFLGDVRFPMLAAVVTGFGAYSLSLL